MLSYGANPPPPPLPPGPATHSLFMDVPLAGRYWYGAGFYPSGTESVQ
jgi:hypothetical protein